MNFIKVDTYQTPWAHWIVDNFLSEKCLKELKEIDHLSTQNIKGRRVGSNRFFITEKNSNVYPNLYLLYQSLKSGHYKYFFEKTTGLDFTGLHPRVEVISDFGEFYLEMHHDHLEKKLTALVYTDFEKLYPGTMLSDNTVIESKDNRCFFFVPSVETYHCYPLTNFDKIRRCLNINYWTYK